MTAKNRPEREFAPQRDSAEGNSSEAAVDVVERQLAAYNARDLARFLACYSEGVTAWRVPALEPALRGRAQFADFYATQRFNREGLRAVILNRMVLGPRVIDHERIFGVRDAPFEVAVAYEVVDGLIVRVHTFAAE
jgi:hypothetical protein